MILKQKFFMNFIGDYFHGNCNIYEPEKFNPTTKCTMGELYDKTIKRQELIKEAGYNIVFIWESDYKKELKARGETQRSMYSK